MASNGRKGRDAGAGSKPKRGSGRSRKRSTTFQTTSGGHPVAPDGSDARLVDPKRLVEYADLMLKGTPFAEIDRQLAKKWKVDPRTCRGYRYRAMVAMQAELEESGQLDKKYEAALFVKRCDLVFRKALEERDYTAANQANKLRGQATGVIGQRQVVQQNQFSGPVVNLNQNQVAEQPQMTPEQSAEILDGIVRSQERARQRRLAEASVIGTAEATDGDSKKPK